LYLTAQTYATYLGVKLRRDVSILALTDCYDISALVSAWPGKVRSRFSEKDMRQSTNLERIPIQPNRDAL
jgi:hypothetical protein